MWQRKQCVHRRRHCIISVTRGISDHGQIQQKLLNTEQDQSQLTCNLFTGIVGAGTNNARLAGLLRGLGSYYYKEPTMLFLVRIAQGLVHMGKGLLTLNPYHTDNQLASGHAPLCPHHASRVGSCGLSDY